MLIVADENIPYAAAAFGGLGDVRLLPGRRISPADVRDADILLVRSVTKVGSPLLAGSKVRFVGTATAGIDHVDTNWLVERGIAFASAAGSNAESVAQYIAAVLLHLRSLIGGTLRGRTIGIVGVGHCGSRVERIARALSMETVLCDPPLARMSGNARYRPLAELAGCDVLTVHTPLTDSGPDATRNLISREFIESMKRGAILIDAARGGIVDEKALAEALDSKLLAGAVLDAWIGEPNIDLELLKRVNIGTPHIAGYSLDGKIRGTEMIHEALCGFLKIQPSWNSATVLPKTIKRVEPTREAPREAPGAPIAFRASSSDLPTSITFTNLTESTPDAGSQAVTKLISLLLVRSVKEGASDILIEPFANFLKVRYRVKRVMRELPHPPRSLMSGLSAKLKSMAGLNVNQLNVAQTGRARVSVDDKQVELEINTVPTVAGESISIRIFENWSAPAQTKPVIKGEDILASLVSDAYPLLRDDAALRLINERPPAERGAYFDTLRREYPVRREFAATRVASDAISSETAHAAQALGFDVGP